MLDADVQTMQDARVDSGPHPNERDAGMSRALRDASAAGSQAMDNGQAGSQCDVRQCERQADDLVQSLKVPADVWLTVKGGECIRVDIAGVVAGMACTCQSSNGWLYIGPKGAGCYARGRAGDCLWDDSEFEGCMQGDPACSGMCDELQQRYDADAAKSFDVEVRYSACRDSSCHHVLRIEDACYADRSFESGRSFDCQLSDADILEREAAAQKSR